MMSVLYEDHNDNCPNHKCDRSCQRRDSPSSSNRQGHCRRLACVTSPYLLSFGLGACCSLGTRLPLIVKRSASYSMESSTSGLRLENSRVYPKQVTMQTKFINGIREEPKQNTTLTVSISRQECGRNARVSPRPSTQGMNQR